MTGTTPVKPMTGFNNSGYTGTTQSAPVPPMPGLTPPRQVESSIQQVDIKIPDFLKTKR